MPSDSASLPIVSVIRTDIIMSSTEAINEAHPKTPHQENFFFPAFALESETLQLFYYCESQKFDTGCPILQKTISSFVKILSRLRRACFKSKRTGFRERVTRNQVQIFLVVKMVAQFLQKTHPPL